MAIIVLQLFFEYLDRASALTCSTDKGRSFPRTLNVLNSPSVTSPLTQVQSSIICNN